MKQALFVGFVALACASGCLEEPQEIGELTAADLDTSDYIWITTGVDALPVVERALGHIEHAYEISATEGEIAVVRMRHTLVPTLSHAMHREVQRCSGFVVHESPEAAQRVLAVDFDQVTQKEALVGYIIDNQSVAQPLIDAITSERILDTISVLSGFTNRFYTTSSGNDAALWLHALWTDLANGRTDVTVEFFRHFGIPQPSVVMTIQGTIWPDEIVVIGGHLDSISGPSPGEGTLAPGADDNASGIATLTEVARVALANGYRPARTVQFMGYAAEEVGLVGSARIAQSYVDQGVNVVGVLQLDMTNYNGSARDIYLINDYTNSTQNQFLGNLIDTYLGIQWGNTACGYACSDHASWTNRGFIASFPTESRVGQHNPNIHTPADTVNNVGNNADHAAKFGRLASAYMAEIAEGTLDGSGNDPSTQPPAP